MSLSILLATRNNGEYIGELIASVLSQSCGDFTLYIRDDCSRDNTLEIIAALKDDRIKIVPNEKPSGSAQNNFFALFSVCDSDYIMFCDADDVWLPDKVEKTLARMKELEQKHGDSCPILVHTDLIVADRNLNVISPSLFRYEKISPGRKRLGELVAQNNVTGCTVMVNRALHELCPSPPKYSVMHDWWLALIASAFGEISALDEPTMFYRQHGANDVGAYNASDLGAAFRKLSKRQRIKEIYASMYRQARCFAATFKDRLSPEQLDMCNAYASMEHKNKLGKLSTIIKYKFYKNTLLRNIGQFLMV